MGFVSSGGCSGSYFYHEQELDLDDFGEWQDTSPETAQRYGCGNRQFITFKYPKEGVLERNAISLNEYFEICASMEFEMDIGECQRCA